MAEERSTRLAISLPRFDGPFDLLISLIRRNEWSIDDLPVLEITRQFLAYLQASEDIDAELGGEFIETASWLVLLKSRSMLPAEDSETPPQEELRRAVLDHARLSAATDLLRGRYDRNLHPGCGGAPVGRSDSVLPPSVDDAPTVNDVLAAAQQAIAAARAAASFRSLDVNATTIEQQTRWIASKLAAIPVNTAVSTADWFTDQPDAGARVALFLALLELTRKGFLLLNQAAESAPIRIKALCVVPEDVHVEEQAFALLA